jgi:hypothetical protein
MYLLLHSTEKERLLLAYRYMKEKVSEQEVPEVLYLPEDEVMRRFGYNIAIRKIMRNYDTVTTLCFKV